MSQHACRMAILLVGCMLLVSDSRAWTRLPGQFAYSRYSACLAEVKGRLVLIGGKKRSGEPSKPVEVWNPDTGRWTTRRVPPFDEIHHFDCPKLGTDRIVVGGGYYGRVDPLSSLPGVWIYTPKTDRWKKITTFPVSRRRGSCGAVVRKNKIYFVGGSIGHGQGDVSVAWLDEYDIKSKRWRRLPNAPNVRDHHRAVRYQSLLIVAGGRNSQRGDFLSVAATLRQIDIYNFNTGKWRSTANILPPPGHAGCGLALVGGTIVIAGGEIDNPDQGSPIKTVKLDTTHRIRVGKYRARSFGRLSQVLNYPGCASCGGRVFCAGGGDLNTMDYAVVNPTSCRSASGFWTFA